MRILETLICVFLILIAGGGLLLSLITGFWLGVFGFFVIGFLAMAWLENV